MELINQWVQLLSESTPRLLGLAAWLLIIMLLLTPLERLWPVKKQKVFRKNFIDDLFYYFMGGIIPAFFVVAILYPAKLVQTQLPQSVYFWVGELPFWCRLAATLVLGEIAYYWAHRWSHEVPYLWRFHSIHHSPTEIDWLVNTRAHPIDLAFDRSVSSSFLLLVGLGHRANSDILDLVAMILIFNTTWGFFIHTNCRIRLGFLEYLITSPAFHHWHHANDNPEVINKNYSALLPWVDKLFGTFYLPRHQLPQQYGINNPIPDTLVDELLMPFRKRTSK
ncbi:sterol desaturase family protein [Methylomonas albis]|uniref:Sterol desaturase family protein n=1 Tax=Methylomonas albis TaxID=1854563 RepID=A0ABR9D6E7_9GAMM|nr:sterol desaturase family protein [Methylomonas albis]MBD9357863.1 sterol desaturase family protein [Methylomonas albis]